MLREVTNAQKSGGEPRRRWFSSAACDLLVWLGEGGEVLGFQFSYDKSQREQAFSWRSSESRASEVAFDAARVAQLFGAESSQVPEPYASLVLGKILDYGRSRTARAALTEGERP